MVIFQGKKKILKKKENPTYAILRKVWKHKKKNGVKLTSNYQYDAY